MNRIQLKFKDIAEIVGGEGVAIITLTDMEERRALNVVCDSIMKDQLGLRVKHVDSCEKMLPEVLAQILQKTDARMELMIYDLMNGEYKVSLLYVDTLGLYPIRLSDAVLLHYISGTPIYIIEELFLRQHVPYIAAMRGISLPINTLDVKKLKAELEKAIKEENYRLASVLQSEINKRSEQ